MGMRVWRGAQNRWIFQLEEQFELFKELISVPCGVLCGQQKSSRTVENYYAIVPKGFHSSSALHPEYVHADFQRMFQRHTTVKSMQPSFLIDGFAFFPLQNHKLV